MAQVWENSRSYSRYTINIKIKHWSDCKYYMLGNAVGQETPKLQTQLPNRHTQTHHSWSRLNPRKRSDPTGHRLRHLEHLLHSDAPC
jgi:hypothetical protein